MDPRGIIRRGSDSDEEPLQILIDTASMNEQLSFGNSDAERLLHYHDNEFFRFARTPETARYDELDRITSYELVDHEDRGRGLHVEWETYRGTIRQKTAFWYDDDDIKRRAARIYSDSLDDYATKSDIEAVTDQQYRTVRKAFIQAALNTNEEGHLFITENEVLLSNRRWFEEHFPGVQLNIMNVEEAIEYLGLYLRFRNEFYIGPSYLIDRSGWYWHLFRSLVPYYHVEADANDDYMRGLSTRFENLLIALDEVGYQYFQTPDNRTKMNIKYHFDYGISLITGVFDALALKTAVTLDIEGIDKEYTSLSNNRGREFLHEVREKNAQLRAHITDYMEYINLIYAFRPLIIHRGSYQDGILEDRDTGWKSGTIMLDHLSDDDKEEFMKYYREQDDEQLPYDPISAWGMCRPDDPTLEHLEPYHFLKQAIFTLVEFVNEYLELLGYSNFIEARQDSDEGHDFVDTCTRIRTDALTHFTDRHPE